MCLIDPPVGLVDRLDQLPDGAHLVRPDSAAFDVAILFSRSRDLLTERLDPVRRRLSSRGTLWLAWLHDPDASDLDFNKVQAAGLSIGMVDNKRAELDERWNGLRFVVRPQNRSSWPD